MQLAWVLILLHVFIPEGVVVGALVIGVVPWIVQGAPSKLPHHSEITVKLFLFHNEWRALVHLEKIQVFRVVRIGQRVQNGLVHKPVFSEVFDVLQIFFVQENGSVLVELSNEDLHDVQVSHEVHDSVGFPDVSLRWMVVQVQ